MADYRFKFLFEKVKEERRLKEQNERYVQLHGRIIRGYCNCCGAIVEITGECRHDLECIHPVTEEPCPK